LTRQTVPPSKQAAAISAAQCRSPHRIDRIDRIHRLIASIASIARHRDPQERSWNRRGLPAAAPVFAFEHFAQRTPKIVGACGAAVPCRVPFHFVKPR